MKRPEEGDDGYLNNDTLFYETSNFETANNANPREKDIGPSASPECL